jgi:3-phenylpropionate/trans-cinnamate dioxygenase ferredoxin subunit
LNQPLERIVLCRAEELGPGERRIAAVAGTEVGVFNLGDRFVAYRNLCPHQGAPVCLGRVSGTTLPSAPGEYVFGLHGRVLTCPWHGWQFDLETGRALGSRERLAPIEVAVEDGTVVLYAKRRRER